MSPSYNNNKQHDVSTDATSGWDVAISTAVRQLQAVESMRARLNVALEYFKDRKKSGDRFPGEKKLREEGILQDI
jgi:hypothetical protein